MFGQHVVLINKCERLHSARPGRHRWLEKLGMWCMYMHKPISIKTTAYVYYIYMYIHTHVFTHICTWMYMYIGQALTVKFTQMGVYIYYNNNNNPKYTLTHFGTTDLPENCCLCEAGSLHMHAVNISVAEPSRGPAMDGVSKNWLALVRLAGSLLIFAGYIYIYT